MPEQHQIEKNKNIDTIAKKPKNGKPKTRDWILGPKGPTCFKSEANKCYVVGELQPVLQPASVLSDFQDNAVT